MTLYNLARVYTATIGTGTLTLGAAVSGFLTFSGAGVVDGSTVSYGIREDSQSEVGRGVWDLASNTLTRATVLNSTAGGAKISLTGSAQVIITALAQDFAQLSQPVEYLQWNTNGTSQADTEGLTSWDTVEGGIKTTLAGGKVHLNHGFEILVPRRCKNQSGVDIKNGNLVYISGGNGTNANITLAKADAEATSAVVIGMATEDINNNSQGWVAQIGLVRGDSIQPINTVAYSPGDTLYLSPTTAGAFTSTKPVAPNHMVIIGTVFRSHASEGIILLHITNGFEISELHDVLVTALANNDALVYESATSLWKNKAAALLAVANTFTKKQTITVPTTTEEALVLKTSDDNTTKNLFEAQSSAGTALTKITATGKILQTNGLALPAADALGYNIKIVDQTAAGFAAGMYFQNRTANGYATLDFISNGGTINDIAQFGVGNTSAGAPYTGVGYIAIGSGLNGLLMQSVKSTGFIRFDVGGANNEVARLGLSTQLWRLINPAAALVTAVFRAHASQSVNIFEIQNSSSVAQTFVTSDFVTVTKGRRHAYAAKTANYSLTSNDEIVNCTANSFTITLPTAVSVAGQVHNIKNSGTGTITLATTSSQTIDGQASGTITLSQYEAVTVASDGANWIII